MPGRGDAEHPGVHVERAQTHRCHPLEPGLVPRPADQLQRRQWPIRRMRESPDVPSQPPGDTAQRDGEHTEQGGDVHAQRLDDNAARSGAPGQSTRTPSRRRALDRRRSQRGCPRPGWLLPAGRSRLRRPPRRGRGRVGGAARGCRRPHDPVDRGRFGFGHGGDRHHRGARRSRGRCDRSPRSTRRGGRGRVHRLRLGREYAPPAGGNPSGPGLGRRGDGMGWRRLPGTAARPRGRRPLASCDDSHIRERGSRDPGSLGPLGDGPVGMARPQFGAGPCRRARGGSGCDAEPGRPRRVRGRGGRARPARRTTPVVATHPQVRGGRPDLCPGARPGYVCRTSGPTRCGPHGPGGGAGHRCRSRGSGVGPGPACRARALASASTGVGLGPRRRVAPRGGRRRRRSDPLAGVVRTGERVLGGPGVVVVGRRQGVAGAPVDGESARVGPFSSGPPATAGCSTTGMPTTSTSRPRWKREASACSVWPHWLGPLPSPPAGDGGEGACANGDHDHDLDHDHRLDRLAALRAGAIAGLVCFALHSGFDFLWHVPVVPLVAAVAVGLAAPLPAAAQRRLHPVPPTTMTQEVPNAS